MKGEFTLLLEEGSEIQKGLKSSSKPRTIAEISKWFLQEMQKGNINGAIKILTNNMENEILPINEDTLKLLHQKHPAKDPPKHILLSDDEQPVHTDFMFDFLTDIYQDYHYLLYPIVATTQMQKRESSR